ASAQLLSDRIASTDDPQVAALAPRFMQALDRAIALCSATLTYGQAQNTDLNPVHLYLRNIVEDVRLSLDLRPADNQENLIQFRNEVPVDLATYADPDQMYRVLLNLPRNAYQALGASPGMITVSATTAPDGVTIDVTDN